MWWLGVKQLPYLRCPVCGKLSLFRNFLGFHKVDALSCSTKGLGRGKGFKNIWKHEPVEGNLIEWWIKRLKGVISYLERINQPPATINEVTSKNVETNFYSVSELCVSPLTKTVIARSPLTLTEMLTLNVPKCSLKLFQYSKHLLASISKKP